MEAGPSQAEGVPAFTSEEEAVAAPGEEFTSEVGFGAADELRDRLGAGGVEPEKPADETDLTEWLRSMDSRSAEAKTAEEPVEKAPAEELPFWLAGLEAEADQKPAAAVDEGLPDWLRVEAEGAPPQAEPTSPADWRRAEAEEPARAEEAFTPEAEAKPAPVPAAEMPAPAAVAPEAKPEPKPQPPAPEREPYREPVPRVRTGMTGMLSPIQDTGLSGAQNELTRGNIPGAMEGYGKLIKKGKLLDEIIFDLREALYRYPVEVTILQTLGDAYMRANRLQDALDAYTKAEELLR
jgi:tetratricopeptide (TPR) repeat protein